MHCADNFHWADKYPVRDMENGKVRAAGMALAMQGSCISNVDVGSCTLKPVSYTHLWQDKHHVLAVEWDSVFEVTDEQIEQLAMDTDNISHIGVFPQDIIISASKAKSVLAYNNKNIIRIKDYKIVEELKTWEVSCELNNHSTIYANLPKHTEANMLSKNINDELYIKKFYLLG